MLDNSGSTFIRIAPEIGVNLNDKFALRGNLSCYHIYGANDFFSKNRVCISLIITDICINSRTKQEK